MATLWRAVRWAARAVGACTALLRGGMSWLIDVALTISKAAACPHCDSAHMESVTPRLYEQQSTWYRCSECGRIRSIPNPPTMPDSANKSRARARPPVKVAMAQRKRAPVP